MTALPEAFWRKVVTTDCWVWNGAVNSRGYACFLVDGKAQLAHRLAYEDAHGPIPDGLIIDHTCRVRNCVNPAHLEPVTYRENNLRGRAAVALKEGGICQRGHLLTEANIYRHPRGHIECRTCRGSRVHRRGRKVPITVGPLVDSG